MTGCPCCGYETLPERNAYEICPVCYWEDDPVQRRDISYSGGANAISLVEGQQNYQRYGASKEHLLVYVRKPHPHEGISANFNRY